MFGQRTNIKRSYIKCEVCTLPYLGRKGEEGSCGLPGQDGLPGAPGPPGDQGHVGEQGYAGPQGKNSFFFLSIYCHGQNGISRYCNFILKITLLMFFDSSGSNSENF